MLYGLPDNRYGREPRTNQARRGHPRRRCHAFFERHHAELSRLARLLLGGWDSAESADDPAAVALVALWHRWDRMRAAGHPLASARGVRGGGRQHDTFAYSQSHTLTPAHRAVLVPARRRAPRGPDVSAAPDVRAAPDRLPYRKRACVVLRHAFGLSERETARVLGISAGTVKSQTSRGIAELERLLTEVRRSPRARWPRRAP